MKEQPKIYALNGSYLIAESRGVLIGVYKVGFSRPIFLEIKNALLDCSKRYPGKFTIVTIYRTYDQKPGDMQDNLRKEAAELLRMIETTSVACASVMEVNGFAAALMRGAITGVQLLARSKVPLKVFSTVSEALAWTLPLSIDRGGVDGRRYFEALVADLLKQQDSAPARAMA